MQDTHLTSNCKWFGCMDDWGTWMNIIVVSNINIIYTTQARDYDTFLMDFHQSFEGN